MKYFITAMILIVLPQSSFAEASLDAIDKKIDNVLGNQEVIINSVENNPLEGKSYGVEFNVFRALSYGVNSEGDTYSEKTLSGAFSIFDVENRVEYAFPIFYTDIEDTSGNSISTFSLLSIDMQYRKFLGETLNGFFLTGLVRAAQLKGTLGNYGTWPPVQTTETGSELKFGAGVGIGYRIFSESGWYWGTSLIAGRYFVGEHDKFYYGNGPYYDDAEIFIDMDLLKFGYAF